MKYGKITVREVSERPDLYDQIVNYVESKGYSFIDFGVWSRYEDPAFGIAIGYINESVSLSLVDPDCMESGSYLITSDWDQIKAFVDNFILVDSWIKDKHQNSWVDEEGNSSFVCMGDPEPEPAPIAEPGDESCNGSCGCACSCAYKGNREDEFMYSNFI